VNDDDELPAWIKILERGSLNVDRLTPARLKSEFEARIPALLESYGADNTLDGWRDVAIQLAITYHPALTIKTNFRKAKSNRPVEAGPWLHRQAVLSRKRKLVADAKRRGLSTRVDAEAARQVHTEYARNEAAARLRLRGKDTSKIIKTPSVKRLQNLLTTKPSFPESLTTHDHFFKAFHLARKVALKLPSAK
jgi:hypothetical protein